MGCEFEGKVEAHDTVGMMSENKIFKSLGKDSNTGYLLMRCPQCGKVIAVDPLKTVFSRKMKGYPISKKLTKDLWSSPKEKKMEEEEGEADSSNRILCSDGNCIGVINERGVCNVCGKPYVKKTMEKEGKNVLTYNDRVVEMLNDLVNAWKKQEDSPFEIARKAADVFTAISAVVLFSAHRTGAYEKDLEEFVGDYTAEIGAAFKDDILTTVRTFLGDKRE
jgi:hypothetical protein